MRKRAYLFDGSCPVSIRITNNRTSAYIPTNVVAAREDIVDGSIRPWSSTAELISGPLKEIREIVSTIDEAESASMTASEIVARVKAKLEDKKGFRLDFIDYMKQIGEKKGGGSGQIYICAANAICRHTGEDTLDISQITVRFLRGFEEFLWNDTGKRNTPKNRMRKPSLYLGYIRHAHNLARYEFNDPDLGLFRIPYSPFEYYHVPSPPSPVHKNKDISMIQQMIDSRKSLIGRKRLGVDVFLISFALMGMNVPDLYSVKAPKDGILYYWRQKTTNQRKDRAEMKVRMSQTVAPLFEEYKGKNGYAFDFRDRYVSFVSVGQNANRGLHAWLKEMGIEKFSLYSARHSWGTIARSAKSGIDKAVVNECLCHVDPDMKITDIYVERDWTVLWEANEKLLSLFDWSKL